MTIPDRIAAWLPTARWFAAKGNAIAAVAVADQAELPGGITLAIVEVASAGGERSRYAVPVDREGRDAALTPAFAGWLVETALGAGAKTTARGAFEGHAAHSSALRGFQTPAVAPLGGDASNTSMLVRTSGAAYAVKLLRRCREGIQPEVEIGEFLVECAPWDGTPRLRGWLEHRGDGAATAIATVHDFAPGCTSAWDRLVALCGAGGLAGPHREKILGIVAALGRATAGMHRALGSRTDRAAFAPEPATAAGRSAAAARMAGHAREVFKLAAARLPQLPVELGRHLAAMLDHRERLLAGLEALAGLPATASDIRVHGDFHLGQVLVGPDDARILVIDFEGEPGRSLAERRSKTSACKDVAGMCRSFDYLLRHVARTTGADYRAHDLALLEQTYLDAYREIARGHAWWPTATAEADGLLAAYTLDKAIYELAYELRNRPDWVEVPLAALVAKETACEESGLL
jgi:trehalose synthase-fused probable maltokinase